MRRLVAGFGPSLARGAELGLAGGVEDRVVEQRRKRTLAMLPRRRMLALSPAMKSLPAAAVDGVAAVGATGHVVAADEVVVAGATDDVVAALAADDDVVAGAAEHHVVAASVVDAGRDRPPAEPGDQRDARQEAQSMAPAEDEAVVAEHEVVAGTG